MPESSRVPQLMLDERKAAILRAIVEEYIQTAQPVGSSHVVSATKVQVSSATIRNDMVALERDGYLQQPHTSAGRVPTEKGYRFFVDHLGRPGLGEGEVLTVHAFFERTHNRLEELLADTSRLLANLTSYTAVVIGDPVDAASIRSVHLAALDPLTVVEVLVLSNGSVDKRVVELDEVTDEDRVRTAEGLLSAALVGATVARPGPVPPSGDRLVEALTAKALAAFEEPASDTSLYVGGAAQITTAFNAIETVRAVLSVLEEQFVVVTLLRDILDRGLNVAIGTETGVAPLAECSLVVAPYLIDGQAAGSIGVLGPTRMNYPQALAAVAVVSNQLGDRLSKG
ncbi:MAG: heat-inducible transcription repressor HrcA [Acidimicrobiia bacterium]|nr:heat-inducible transcription repressor HrcA [Acidimicrobiia bacterium]